MAGKYDKYIVTETKEYPPEAMAAMQEKMKNLPPVETTVEIERLLWMDDTMVEGAKFYMECIWLWPGVTTSGTTEEPHVHDFTEVIGFISSDRNNAAYLDGRMEMHIGDEVIDVEKSCLMHIPPGLPHCPLTFREVRRPTFFFTLAPISNYGRTSGLDHPEALKQTSFVPPESPDASGTKYGRYIITEPKSHAPADAPPPPKPEAETTHVVSLDDEVSKGAFYVDFVWIWEGKMTMAPEAHTHDTDEMIGIIGFDPDNPRGNPRGITGDVSIMLGDEKHMITRSSLIYVPGGLKHCPIEFDVKKPVLVFTIANMPAWKKEE